MSFIKKKKQYIIKPPINSLQNNFYVINPHKISPHQIYLGYKFFPPDLQSQKITD